MKVVYNACYGGFDLSDEAVKWLQERGGHPFVRGYRHDPLLVEMVETLGEEKASGAEARLRVKEVLGNCYRIIEFNGREKVETPESISWIRSLIPTPIGRILPPTGWDLTPYARNLLRIRSCEPTIPYFGDSSVPATVIEEGGALFYVPCPDGKIPRSILEFPALGQPIYYGPPESPSPISMDSGVSTSRVRVGDSVTRPVERDCPTCKGVGTSRGGCHDCLIPYMKRGERLDSYAIVGEDPSTGFRWLQCSFPTEERAQRFIDESLIRVMDGTYRFLVLPRSEVF